MIVLCTRESLKKWQWIARQLGAINRGMVIKLVKHFSWRIESIRIYGAPSLIQYARGRNATGEARSEPVSSEDDTCGIWIHPMSSDICLR
jgi:hypothetical protein